MPYYEWKSSFHTESLTNESQENKSKSLEEIEKEIYTNSVKRYSTAIIGGVKNCKLTQGILLAQAWN